MYEWSLLAELDIDNSSERFERILEHLILHVNTTVVRELRRVHVYVTGQNYFNLV